MPEESTLGKLVAYISLDAQAFQVGLAKCKEGFEKATADMNKLAGASKMFLTGHAIGLVALAREASNLDASLISLRATTKASDEQFKQMTETAERLSATTKFTTSQIVDGMNALAQSGRSVADIQTISANATNLAAATGMDYTGSVSALNMATKRLGASAGETAELTDLMAKAMNQGGVDAGQFASALRVMGPQIKASHRDMQEVVAVLDAFSQSGMVGMQAGRMLNTVMRSLAEGNKSAAKEFKDLGVETTGTMGRLRPMIDVLQDVYKKTENLSEIERQQTFTKLFGMAGAGLAGVSPELFGESKEKYAGTEGYASSTAEQRAGTLQGAMERIKKDWTELQESIGQILLPQLKSILSLTEKWVKVFTSMSPETKQQITFWIETGAKIALVTIAAQKFLQVSAAISAAVKGISLDWASVGTVVGLGVGAIAVAFADATAKQRSFGESFSELYFKPLSEANRILDSVLSKHEELMGRLKKSREESQKAIEATDMSKMSPGERLAYDLGVPAVSFGPGGPSVTERKAPAKGVTESTIKADDQRIDQIKTRIREVQGEIEKLNQVEPWSEALTDVMASVGAVKKNTSQAYEEVIAKQHALLEELRKETTERQKHIDQQKGVKPPDKKVEEAAAKHEELETERRLAKADFDKAMKAAKTKEEGVLHTPVLGTFIKTTSAIEDFLTGSKVATRAITPSASRMRYVYAHDPAVKAASARFEAATAAAHKAREEQTAAEHPAVKEAGGALGSLLGGAVSPFVRFGKAVVPEIMTVMGKTRDEMQLQAMAGRVKGTAREKAEHPHWYGMEGNAETTAIREVSEEELAGKDPAVKAARDARNKARARYRVIQDEEEFEKTKPLATDKKSVAAREARQKEMRKLSPVLAGAETRLETAVKYSTEKSFVGKTDKEMAEYATKNKDELSEAVKKGTLEGGRAEKEAKGAYGSTLESLNRATELKYKAQPAFSGIAEFSKSIMQKLAGADRDEARHREVMENEIAAKKVFDDMLVELRKKNKETLVEGE